jgi:hypothetical protein
MVVQFKSIIYLRRYWAAQGRIMKHEEGEKRDKHKKRKNKEKYII